MGYTFSKSSLSRLDTCEEDLQIIMMTAISTSLIDFGISEGHRSADRQFELYKQGREEIRPGTWVKLYDGMTVTNVDGVHVKGKHNHDPSQAVDIFAWHDNKVKYDDHLMGYLAGHILATAKELYKAGRIKSQIEWGGLWKSLKDTPHYETV